jgi:hypothetical protein
MEQAAVECTHCNVLMTSWGSAVRYYKCPKCTRTYCSAYDEVFKHGAGARKVKREQTPPAASEGCETRVAIPIPEVLGAAPAVGAAAATVSPPEPASPNVPKASPAQAGSPPLPRRRQSFAARAPASVASAAPVATAETATEAPTNLHWFKVKQAAARWFERLDREEQNQREVGARIIEEADPWSLLGVSEQASLEELRAAYRRAALTHHPDRGGDPDAMQRLNRAYHAAREARSVSGKALAVARPRRR